MRKTTAVNLVTGILLLVVIAAPIYVGSWWWSSAEPAQPVVLSEAVAKFADRLGISRLNTGAGCRTEAVTNEITSRLFAAIVTTRKQGWTNH